MSQAIKDSFPSLDEELIVYIEGVLFELRIVGMIHSTHVRIEKVIVHTDCT